MDQKFPYQWYIIQYKTKIGCSFNQCFAHSVGNLKGKTNAKWTNSDKCQFSKYIREQVLRSSGPGVTKSQIVLKRPQINDNIMPFVLSLFLVSFSSNGLKCLGVILWGIWHQNFFSSIWSILKRKFELNFFFQNRRQEIVDWRQEIWLTSRNSICQKS